MGAGKQQILLAHLRVSTAFALGYCSRNVLFGLGKLFNVSVREVKVLIEALD